MLYSNALRPKERRRDLSTRHEHYLSRSLAKTVECYMDDIAVKSRSKSDHLQDLKAIFDIMRAHQLKMNPAKSFLGVSSGKFLGFIVSSRGIHVDRYKVKAIQSMQPPKNLKELRSLQGRLACI